MKAMIVRFSDLAYASLKAAAEREGIPISQFIREAVIIRCVYEAGVTAGVGMTQMSDPAVLEPIREAIKEATREFLEAGE
jgi:hypothetical protein